MRNDNAKTDYTAIVAAYATQDRRHWRRQDYYTYAYSLQKLRQYEAGHGVAREGLLRWPQDERLGRVYGWCVYYAYILPFRREAGNRDVYFRAVRSILQYCRQSPYTPYERTVWHLLQTFQGDPHLSHAERDRYISALDPELLAANACHADGEGILSCTQSPREKWYALKTKYAVKLKQYDRCIALCEEALRRFPECHNNNDIWFSYRIAYCHLLQGQTDRSEREFQALLRYSRHWIVYRGLMYAAVRKKDDRKALQYGSMAMLALGEVTAKIHVLTELATLLRNRQDMQTAYWHEAWTVYWREKKHWHMEEALRQRVRQSPFPVLTPDELQTALFSFWRTTAHAGEPLYTGSIARLLPAETGGFVRLYTGEEFFFGKEETARHPWHKGEPVTFYLSCPEGGAAARRAVHIQPLSDGSANKGVGI